VPSCAGAPRGPISYNIVPEEEEEEAKRNSLFRETFFKAKQAFNYTWGV